MQVYTITAPPPPLLLPVSLEFAGWGNLFLIFGVLLVNAICVSVKLSWKVRDLHVARIVYSGLMATASNY